MHEVETINRINYLYNKSNVFILTIYIPCGSIYENYGTYKNKKFEGLSHFIEHLLFKHTENFTGKEILQEFTRIGGYYNASTDKDQTMFYVKTLTESYKTAIDLLYDIVVKPVFLEEDVKTERRVVLEELAQSKDDLGDALFQDSTYTLLSKNNLYSSSVIGKSTHLRGVKVDDIIQYYKKHYKDIMVVVNCDKKYKKEIQNYVSLKFGKNDTISFYNPKMHKESNKFNTLESDRFCLAINDTYQYSTSILFPSYEYCDSKKNTILNFVKYCLTDAGLYSLLSYEIREKRGLVYSIRMSNERMRYVGLLRITFSTSNKDIVNILGVVLDVLDNIKRFGLSKDDLKYFKDSYKSNMMYKFTNEEYRASWYGDNLFYGTKQTQKDLLDEITKISNNDIKKIARDVFQYNKMGFYSNGNYDNETELYKSLQDVVKLHNGINVI
jgi:predicted Zn-dependent peptidase